MPQLENVRHEKFARLVAAGDHASVAYVGAGYSAKNPETAKAAASRLLSDVNVSARVAEIRAELEQAAQKAATVTKEWIVEKLRENALRALEIDQGNVANRALELLGKEIGMFVERRETKVTDERRNESDILADLEREGIRVAVRAGRGAAGEEATGKPH